MPISAATQQQLATLFAQHSARPIEELNPQEIQQIASDPQVQAGMQSLGVQPGDIRLEDITAMVSERGQAGAELIDPRSEANYNETRSIKKSPLGMQMFSRMKRKASAFLTLAGVKKPPEADKLEANVDQVVELALQNKQAIQAGTATKTFLDNAAIKQVANAVLGCNQGQDQLVEAFLRHTDDQEGMPKVHTVDAFDRAGFHVMNARFDKKDDGVLDVYMLRASHGRNCTEFKLNTRREKEPGRGNALPVAKGLEALLLEGAKSGLHRITTTPGSPNVAALYQKMGFRVEGHTDAISNPQTKQPMYLDLTNREVVHQALVTFALGRATVTDVPKDVTQRLVEFGDKAPVPTRETVSRDFNDADIMRLE